jgi:hypothetical protein
VGISQFDEVAPFIAAGTLQLGDGTGYKAISVVQPTALRLDGIVCLNSDTVDHVVNIALKSAGQEVELGGVNVPAGSGLGGLAVVDLVPSLAPAAIGGILVPPGWYLEALVSVAVASGKSVTVNAFGGFI